MTDETIPDLLAFRTEDTAHMFGKLAASFFLAGALYQETVHDAALEPGELEHDAFIHAFYEADDFILTLFDKEETHDND